jgi:hypothetical protein
MSGSIGALFEQVVQFVVLDGWLHAGYAAAGVGAGVTFLARVGAKFLAEPVKKAIEKWPGVAVGKAVAGLPTVVDLKQNQELLTQYQELRRQGSRMETVLTRLRQIEKDLGYPNREGLVPAHSLASPQAQIQVSDPRHERFR